MVEYVDDYHSFDTESLRRSEKHQAVGKATTELIRS